jgi:hypothetical protein
MLFLSLVGNIFFIAGYRRQSLACGGKIVRSRDSLPKPACFYRAAFTPLFGSGICVNRCRKSIGPLLRGPPSKLVTGCFQSVVSILCSDYTNNKNRQTHPKIKKVKKLMRLF